METLRAAISFGETTARDGTIQEQDVAGEMGMGRKLLGQYEAQFSVQLKLAGALAMRQERALQEALEKIACPTLVVRGAASDVLSAEEADRMADETLSNGRLAVVSQAGHSVMLDNPEGFLDAVSGFVLGED